jgi:hypothetical protein
VRSARRADELNLEFGRALFDVGLLTN